MHGHPAPPAARSRHPGGRHHSGLSQLCRGARRGGVNAVTTLQNEDPRFYVSHPARGTQGKETQQNTAFLLPQTVLKDSAQRQGGTAPGHCGRRPRH